MLVVASTRLGSRTRVPAGRCRCSSGKTLKSTSDGPLLLCCGTVANYSLRTELSSLARHCAAERPEEGAAPGTHPSLLGGLLGASELVRDGRSGFGVEFRVERVGPKGRRPEIKGPSPIRPAHGFEQIDGIANFRRREAAERQVVDCGGSLSACG
jgi:hypothetical protein